MSAQVASWYGEAWKYRWPISVNVSTAGATSDVEILIPPDFDLFWDNVDPDGDDVRVTTADGKTLVTTMDLGSWVYASRQGVIEIDGLDTTTGSSRLASAQILWVYWGNSAATTVVSAFAPAAAITGYICLEQPVPARTILCIEEAYGTTRPSRKLNAYSDAATAEQDYWFDVTDVLAGRSRPYNNGTGLEGMAGFYCTVWNLSSKAAVASASLEALARVCYDSRGRVYAKVRLDVSGTLSVGTYYAPLLYLLSSLDTGKTTAYGAHLYVHDLVT